MPLQALVLPDSVLEELDDPKLRTYKAGTLGRAAAVFGVPEVRIYHDPLAEANHGPFLQTVLSYQSTPPYLRKRLFPLQDDLKYAGVLPPLNTPTHTVHREPEEGEVREGVVLPGGELEAGIREPVKMREDVEPGERVLVEVEAVERDGVFVRLARDPPYTGFTVERYQNLPAATRDMDLRVGTSRDGEPVPHLRRALRAHGEGAVGIAFGPPGRGLEEILPRQGSSLREAFDVVVNTIPGQRTRTVRTEEATWVTLGLVNGWPGGAPEG